MGGGDVERRRGFGEQKRKTGVFSLGGILLNSRNILTKKIKGPVLP
jgi:hypothetical protein